MACLIQVRWLALVPEVENQVEINTGKELLGCKRNWGGGEGGTRPDPEVSAIWQKASLIFFVIWLMRLHESLFKKEGDGFKASGGMAVKRVLTD